MNNFSSKFFGILKNNQMMIDVEFKKKISELKCKF
jgi:hypothetical protein